MSTARISLGTVSSLDATQLFAISGTVVPGDVVAQVSTADRTVKRADASDATARPPIGIVQSVEGNQALVALNGEVASSLSGLTRGAAYWLATTPGQLTASQPVSDSYPVGIAVSATELRVDTVAASVSASGGGGTVTSVGVSSSDLTVSGSPVTTSGTIDLSLPTVPVAKGGTGQFTKAAAFNALAPAAGANSLIFRNASTAVSLPPDGAALKYLIADSTADAGVRWQSVSTVTSFGLTTAGTDLSISNSPISSGSGTITLNLATVAAATGGTGRTSTGGEGSTIIQSATSPLTYVSQYSSLSWRNKIINGSMMVAQRGTAAVTTDQSYPVDRWMARNTTSAAISVQSISSAVAGWFSRFVRYTVSTGSSATAAQLAAVRQNIEGSTIADLAWGTADAKPITLSFYAASTVLGTYAVLISNADSTRSYVATYTITSSGTQTRFTITIPGDTSGTWRTDSGVGIRVWFDLGSGSDLNTPSAGSWQNGNYATVSGRANFIGTTGAVWSLSTVQLEVGSAATMLEIRSMETETELCQRYFQRLASSSGTLNSFGSGTATSSINAFVYVPYTVPMRGTPTVSQSNTQLYDTAARSVTSLSTASYGDFSLGINVPSSGLTVRQTVLWTHATGTSYVDLNAEI